MTDRHHAPVRIVEGRGHGAAVERQTHETPEMGLRTLGLLAEVETVTDTQHERRWHEPSTIGPVIGDLAGQEGDPSAIVDVRPAPGRRLENRLEPGQGSALEAAAAEMERIVAARAGRPGQIDHPARFEIRRQGHVEQAALAGMEHVGHALDRLRIEHPVFDDAQTARLLGNQDPPVRQEGHAPGVFEPSGDGLARILRRCRCQRQACGEQDRSDPAGQSCSHISPGVC